MPRLWSSTVYVAFYLKIKVITQLSCCICVSGGYVFNTEAHPVDAAALYCCSAERKQDRHLIHDFHDNVDLLALLDLVKPKYDMFATKKSTKGRRKNKLLKSSVQLSKENGPAQTLTAIVDGVTQQPATGQGHSEQGQGQKDEHVTVVQTTTPQTPDGAQTTSHTTIRLPKGTNIDKAVDELIKSLQNKIKVAKTVKEAQETLISTQSELTKLGQGDMTVEATAKTTVTSNSGDQTTQQTKTVSEVKIETSLTTDEGGSRTLSTEGEGKNNNIEEEKMNEAEDEPVCGLDDKDKEEILAVDEEIEDEEVLAHRLSLLTCPAQPFHARLSLMGEMFPDTL